MPEAEIGWIAAIIIGGLAGWLAETFMKSGTGILMNICPWHRWRSIGQLAFRSIWDRTRWMARLSDHGLYRSMHHYLPMARCSGTDRLGAVLSLTGNRSRSSQRLPRSLVSGCCDGRVRKSPLSDVSAFCLGREGLNSSEKPKQNRPGAR